MTLLPRILPGKVNRSVVILYGFMNVFIIMPVEIIPAKITGHAFFITFECGLIKSIGDFYRESDISRTSAYLVRGEGCFKNIALQNFVKFFRFIQRNTAVQFYLVVYPFKKTQMLGQYPGSGKDQPRVFL
jgi:hypothetical protein